MLWGMALEMLVVHLRDELQLEGQLGALWQFKEVLVQRQWGRSICAEVLESWVASVHPSEACSKRGVLGGQEREPTQHSPQPVPVSVRASRTSPLHFGPEPRIATVLGDV
jgi:hypothetical protein